jgi:hypothetical protein
MAMDMGGAKEAQIVAVEEPVFISDDGGGTGSVQWTFSAYELRWLCSIYC